MSQFTAQLIFFKAQEVEIGSHSRNKETFGGFSVLFHVSITTPEYSWRQRNFISLPLTKVVGKDFRDLLLCPFIFCFLLRLVGPALLQCILFFLSPPVHENMPPFIRLYLGNTKDSCCVCVCVWEGPLTQKMVWADRSPVFMGGAI